MDCLASRRALAAKRLRLGQKVNGLEMKDIRRHMHDIARDFKGIWLSRNKISRLNDNMRLFNRAEKELKQVL